MINIGTKKILDSFNKEELQSKFDKIFITKCVEYLTFMEADYLIEMLVSNEHNKLRVALEDMTEKAKKKVLECVEDNCHDEIYESRYRSLKELEDLITYYIERQ